MTVIAPGESLWVTTTGQGPTVVLVPGLFGSAFGYRHLIRDLAGRGFRTVVVEPLAIGSSARPRDADYSLTAQSDRIASVLRSLDVEPAIVVGHAVGGSMVLRLAYRHPERVRAIVLLEGGPTEAAATPGFRHALSLVKWIKWLGGKRILRGQIRKALIASSADPAWVTDEVIEGYTATATAELDQTLDAFRAMARSSEPERLESALPRIASPTHLLVGMVPHRGGPPPDEVRRLADLLPHFAIDSVPGSGHYLFEENAGGVAAIIASIQAELDRAAPVAPGRPQ